MDPDTLKQAVDLQTAINTLKKHRDIFINIAQPLKEPFVKIKNGHGAGVRLIPDLCGDDFFDWYKFKLDRKINSLTDQLNNL